LDVLDIFEITFKTFQGKVMKYIYKAWYSNYRSRAFIFAKEQRFPKIHTIGFNEGGGK